MRFSLFMLLYVVTACAVYIAMDRATAGTSWHNPMGGFGLGCMILGGMFIRQRHRNRAA
ncbi:MAG: hypothetical protein K8T25_00760 [Planctomycetia bacterium]|nr:hypothetical protein [Planctomycetia bacterium]